MRYYSTQRPVAPGTFPKPANNKVLNIWNFDKPIFCEQVGREAWGYIDYEKPLTDKSGPFIIDTKPPGGYEGKGVDSGESRTIHDSAPVFGGRQEKSP